MSDPIDKLEIEIPCKRCGRKIKKSIGWIKSNHELVCFCGQRFTFDPDQVSREFLQIEKPLADLKSIIKKMGK